MGIQRRWVVALVAGAGLLAGGWAVRAAPGMPGSSSPSSTDPSGATRAQVAANEQQVLAQANAEGAQEIAALKTAQARLAQMQTHLQQATGAEATYRQAALQATARAQQLATQLQAQAAPARYGDDTAGDN